MANPSKQWDLIPVYGVYLTAPGDLPMAGQVSFGLSQRVTRTDGRVIYPDGARVRVTIGNPDDQNPTIRAQVRAAWRASDEAADPSFDGSAWDIWWDTTVLPAAVFAGFPASDDPDISQRGWTVAVEESLTSASGKKYAIQPLLTHLDQPIPGINLGLIEVPPGSPTVPAPVYAKGVAGGVAALDTDGDVVDASGAKVTGGGDVASVNGQTGAVTLTASDVGALPASYTPPAPAWSDVSGKPSTFAPAAHTQAISTITGLQAALDGKASSTAIPTTPADIGAATAAQGTKADNAVPSTRKVAGKALTADVTLTASDVGAATVAQGAKADTAVQPADITGFVSSTRKVAGKALSADVTLTAGDVGARPSTWTPGLADLPAALSGILRWSTSWPSRPSARTDLTFIWFDPDGTHGTPSGALTGVDLLLSPQV